MRPRTLACAIPIALVAAAAAPTSAHASPPLNGVNFISVCGFSHRGPDDPIVYPGRPGYSHDHSFVGNTSTNAFSTPATLRAAGTTCSRPGDTAAYWAPTLFAGGAPVPPVDAIVYYRRLTDAKLRAFPPGLEIVGGNSHASAPQSILVTYWDCGNLSDVRRSSDVPDCPDGSNLRLIVNFPDCWNGKSLDSPDHRSHMAYSRAGRCPARYPVALPAISLAYRYEPPVGRPADIALASGGQYSAHADFINAWNQPTLVKLVASCLNRFRHCGTGS